MSTTTGGCGRWGAWRDQFIRSHACTVTAIACLTILSSAMADAQQLPPRDAPRPAETSAGIIRGVVVDAQTGEPLPRAVVDLSTMGGRSQPTAIQTDAEGRFEFRDLPPGRYLLSASRTPYLRTTYGQRGPDSRGTPIEVAADGVVDKIRIAMPPGGVISGRVYDEFGHPAVGIQVQPLQYRYNNGRRELAPAGGFRESTDDLGGYRIWGLTPGQYYVSAAPTQMFRNPRLTADQAGPITTYFPGTSDSAAAQRVTVDTGKEAGGVHIMLVSGRLATALRGLGCLRSCSVQGPVLLDNSERETPRSRAAPKRCRSGPDW